MHLLQDALHDGCCGGQRRHQLVDHPAAVQPSQPTGGCLQLGDDVDGSLRVADSRGGRKGRGIVTGKNARKSGSEAD
jgi:hypothetical protein